MRRIVRSRPSPSLVISLLALFVALGGTAYALSRGEVKTRHIANQAVTTAKLDRGAVKGKQVAASALRLSDFGGRARATTRTVGSTINVPPGGCEGEVVDSFLPVPRGVIGSLVVGSLEDADGDAVLPNRGVVVPTMISETSQGGALANLMVCDIGNAGQTVPAGSVFRYELIGP